jgi:putative membrane protein
MGVFAHVLVLLINVAFLAGIIALVVWGVIRLSHRPTSDNALSILNERFARGEIDQQEYDTRKAALRRG